MIKIFVTLLAALTIISTGAIAGEDPRTVYTKNDGRIDTGTDTSSDGYMRAGTKLVVDCSAAGACVDTPTPPLPPTAGPVARPDTYNMSITDIKTASNGSDSSKPRLIGWPYPYSMTKGTSNGTNVTFFTTTLPVMTNDDEGPLAPATITSIQNFKTKTDDSFGILTLKNPILLTPTADGKGVKLDLAFQRSSDGQLKISFSYTITDARGQISTTNATLTMSAQVSPLVLDLDGDGIEMLPLEQGTYFDIDMDGIKDQMSWVKSDDGFLVFDRNSDGMITHRRELFGNLDDEDLPDGFASLLRYDENKDYVINAQDKIFLQLLVWRDMNKDGIGTPNELKSVSAYGISSFNLNAVKVGLVYGAADTSITHQSTYTLKDGSKRQMADVWFAQVLGAKPPAQESQPGTSTAQPTGQKAAR